MGEISPISELNFLDFFSFLRSHIIASRQILIATTIIPPDNIGKFQTDQLVFGGR